jgi:PPE-repeat protein
MAIGETISHWLWSGPGASSFHSAAAALMNVAGQISAILGGQQANAGVLLTAWASPTGEKAVSANSPYGAWLADAQTQIETAAILIQAAGTAFESAKAMTPTPPQFAENNAEFAVLVATNILGQNWPFIIANRMEYAAYTTQAVTAYSMYTTESADFMGALQPLPAPPVSAIPSSVDPSIFAGLAGQQPFGQVMQGMAALPSVGSAAAQPVSALSQLVSQPSNAVAASAGQLAEAPSSMTPGLGALPSMASAPMTSGLGAPTAGSGGLAGTGADSGGWFGGMPAAGGTVAAALSGGGAGVSGLGGAAALAPMRGPVSWASTANAANPTAGQDADEVVVSRVAEARAASAMPATSTGMGAPGAMAPPAQQASASARERGRDGTLAAPVVLYRPPRNMPVVTGAAGAQFVAGEED